MTAMQNRVGELLCNISLYSFVPDLISAKPSDHKLSPAVADLFNILNPKLVQHGQQQVCHRSPLRTPQVKIAFESAAVVTDQKNRQALMFVNMGIAQRPAIQDHRVI